LRASRGEPEIDPDGEPGRAADQGGEQQLAADGNQAV